MSSQSPLSPSPNSRGSGSQGLPAVLAAWGLKNTDTPGRERSPSPARTPAPRVVGAAGGGVGGSPWVDRPQSPSASVAAAAAAAAAAERVGGDSHSRRDDQLPEDWRAFQMELAVLFKSIHSTQSSLKAEVVGLCKVMEGNADRRLASQDALTNLISNKLDSHHQTMKQLLELQHQDEMLEGGFGAAVEALPLVFLGDAGVSPVVTDEGVDFKLHGVQLDVAADDVADGLKIVANQTRMRKESGHETSSSAAASSDRRIQRGRSQMANVSKAVLEGKVPDVPWEEFQNRRRKHVPAVEDLVEALGWHPKAEPVSDVPSSSILPMKVRTFIASSHFDAFVLSLILLNTAVIAVQTDQQMKRSIDKYELGASVEEPVWYKVADVTFCVVFALEMVVRLLAEERMFFTGQERWLNLLDTLLVLSAMVELIATDAIYKLLYIRTVRALRSVRALRVVRVVRFLRALRVMLTSVMNSLMSFVWGFVFLHFVIFLFGLIFLQAAANFIEDAGRVDEATVHDLRSYFPSMPTTLCTLFMSTSGGLDWGEIYAPLKRVGETYGLLFIFYVAFMTVAILNVIVGIFVEGASESAQIERDVSMLAEVEEAGSNMNQLKQYLKTFDIDGTGSIAQIKLTQFLQDERAIAFFRAQQIDEREAHDLFKLLASSENEATIDEFLVGLMILKGGNGVHVANQWYETRQLMAHLLNFMQYSREHFMFIEETLRDVYPESDDALPGKQYV